MKSALWLRTVLCFVLLAGKGLCQENIAVMDLDAKNVGRDEAGVLTDRLRSEIIKTRKFSVMERGRMDEILKEQGFQQSGVCSSEDCAARAGNIIGVSKMVVGSVGRVGGTYLVTLRMIDVETGKIVRNVEESLRGSIDEVLESGMAKVCLKLMQARDMGPKSAKSGQTSQVPGGFGPSDGCIGFYPMDKVSGSMLMDESGNQKHGSVFGAKVSVKGGLSFDGAENYATMGELPSSREYSVSFWVRPVSLADQAWYCALCGSHLRGGIGFFIKENTLEFVAGATCGEEGPLNVMAYSMDDVEVGKWHHVAGVFSAGRLMVMYVDGKEVKRLTGGVVGSIAPAMQYFGTDPRRPGGGLGFCGKAKDLLVFDRALEVGEIFSLYSAGKNVVK